KAGGILEPKLPRPCLQRAIAADLVMLNRLRRCEKPGIKRLAAGELFHNLLAFLDHADDRIACFAARWLADELEHLVEALHMALGLLAVRFKGLLELLRICLLGHLGKRLEDLLLREVN